MKYICVKWKHDNMLTDPVYIYSEIDESQWEHRKVEVFFDGRKGFADRDREVGGSMLGEEPWPDLQRLGSEPEFDISEITKEQFEMIWNARETT